MARYALIVGLAKYSNPLLPPLSKTATDAAAVAEALKQHGSYRVTLLNGEVTAKQLADALRTLLLEQAVKNEALIYFTGHGITGVTGVDSLEQPQGFLAASDCNVTKAGEQWMVRGGGISLNSLNQLIRQSDLSNLVVIFDSCHSGEFLERGLVENALTVFRSRQDYYLITACRRFEQAWAKKSEQHSVFTGALLAGLSQERAGDNGQVTVDRLFDFIASELSQSRQEPIRMGVGRSLTLVQYPPKKTTVVVDETCPYQGLQAFGKEQARFFFGREKVVQLLMEKLGQANFVPIIGASGSGKSSVVRAALIPQLEKNGWRILEPILPGDEPLAELKTVLIELFGRSEGREVYSLIKTEGLHPVIERLSGSERLLLVVDQFEEVFTLCPKEEERRQFIELLTQVAEIPNSRLVIVTTMRADFLEPCLSYESLTWLIQNEAVYMPPLVGAELEEAIISPAELQGYSFEKGLLGEILQDMGHEKECLPLLQFALTELWEKRDREKHQLTVEQYRVLEGVKGSLNRHAEKIYTYKDFLKEFLQQERSPQEQEWIKRIFLKLVRTGEGIKDTRQRQPKAKLLAITKNKSADEEAIAKVLDELIQGRLLVTGQEKQQEEAWVDLAHETLMEGWRQLADWRQENRELRRLSDRIEDALKEWQEKSQDDSYLLSGGLLSEVQNHWLVLESSLSLTAKEFYRRSENYWQQQEEALKQAEVAKIQLLENTNKELKTPLNGIIGCLRLVRDGYCDDREEELDFLQRADDAAIHLLGIINDLLDIAKIEAKKLTVNIKPINLRKILNEVISLQAALIQHKGLEFHTSDLHEIIAVRADLAKLKQVLLHVVSNAVKFTDSGNITINTRIEPITKIPPLISPNKEDPGEMLVRSESKEESVPLARTDDGDWSSSPMTLSDSCLATLPYRVVVTVKDTGIGIDPDQRHKLFHPFVRVDESTTRKVSGMGLGLTISGNLMKLMGGNINLYSEGNGRGTTVEISLPMIESSQLLDEKLET
jgi:signal transduction histidine kinase